MREEVEESRKRILENFIRERNAFVFRHEAILLGALGLDAAAFAAEASETIAVGA